MRTRHYRPLAASSTPEQICKLVRRLVNSFTRPSASVIPTPHRDDAAKEVDGDPRVAFTRDRRRRALRVQWRILLAGQPARSADQLPPSAPRRSGEGWRPWDE